MKYRIIKHDKFNWAIQEFQEGGGEISRGRYSGQEKQEKWHGRCRVSISTSFFSCFKPARNASQ